MVPAPPLLLTLALALAEPAPPPTTPAEERDLRLQFTLGLASIGVGVELPLTLRDALVLDLSGGPRLGFALLSGSYDDGPTLGLDIFRAGLAWRRSSPDMRQHLDVGLQLSSFGVAAGDGYGGPFASVYFQPSVGWPRLRFAPSVAIGLFVGADRPSLAFFIVPVGLVFLL